MMVMVVVVVWSLSKRIKEVIGELSGCADYLDVVLVVWFRCSEAFGL